MTSTTHIMDSAPPVTNGGPQTTDQLPPEAIALAGKMFDAARKGDEQSVALLTQALQRGLPANLTNDKGDSLVSSSDDCIEHTQYSPASVSRCETSSTTSLASHLMSD